MAIPPAAPVYVIEGRMQKENANLDQMAKRVAQLKEAAKTQKEMRLGEPLLGHTARVLPAECQCSHPKLTENNKK